MLEEGVPVVYWAIAGRQGVAVAGVPTCWLPDMVPSLAAIVVVTAPVVSGAARPRRRKVFVIDCLFAKMRITATYDGLREYTTMGPT
jgi:hypothetical protein